MKTEKLHISFDSFFDFKLIGISCSEKDYRLCWAINQKLGIDMSRVMETNLESRQHIADFPFYEFIDEENGRIFRLLANKFDNKILMNELKTIDYLFLIQGEDANLPSVIEKISAMEIVFWVNELDFDELKDKDLLYLDE